MISYLLWQVFDLHHLPLRPAFLPQKTAAFAVFAARGARLVGLAAGRRGAAGPQAPLESDSSCRVGRLGVEPWVKRIL